MLQADLVEICLWEPESEQLVAYRFVGPEGTEQALEAEKVRYRAGRRICRSNREQSAAGIGTRT